MSKVSWIVMLIVGVMCLWPTKVVALDEAILSLEKDNKTDNVVLKMDSGNNQVTGVDAVIKYDTNKIRIDSVESTGVFSAMTGKIIDNKNGVVRISVSNNYQVFTSGTVDVASLKVVVLNKSGARLDLDFNYGSTRDSNVVVAHGVDVLTKVRGINLTGNSNSNKSDLGKSVKVEPVKSTGGQVLGMMTDGLEFDERMIGWGIGLGFAVFIAGIIFWVGSSGFAIETQLKQ